MHLHTDADLAEMFQISKGTVVRLRNELGWPHVRFGDRLVRYTDAQVREIVALHSHVQTEAGRRLSLALFAGQTPRSAAYWARAE